MAKQYLDLAGLGLYDSKIKALITDAKTAGVNAQTEVDALEAYVGQIPTSYTETDIVSFILKVAEETLNAASGGSSESAASVLAALNTYKASNDVRVKAIEDDYLKADDKTALETEIAKKANAADVYTKTEVDTKLDTKANKATTLAGYGITDTYTKTETDKAIAAEKTRAEAAEKVNANAIAAVKEDVDAFFKDADLTENAKDTLKEIQEYINSDAAAAANMAASIKQNSDAIEALDTSASTAIEAVGTRVAKIEADYATEEEAQSYATAAETKAKTYADSLATNYDAAGAAAQALTDAKAYTDEITAIPTANITALFA